MLTVDTAVAVMLKEPGVNRAVMSWIGTAGGCAGHAWARSTALWTLALGIGEGIPENYRTHALNCLPRHLALCFRGALSVWSAGELPDEVLGPDARAVANTLLLAFTERSISFA
jgi:hypothetical protein